MPGTRAFVCGCSGLTLSEAERAFITEWNPWGLILFKRNVASRDQLRALTEQFRIVVDRADAPVLIDQEGGRVQRLGPPEWPRYPSAATFGALYQRDAAAGIAAARLGARLLAQDLGEVGLTIDCAPVLDLRMPGCSAVVGDRSFGADPAVVAALGRAFAEGLAAAGVLPVVKHMPGHGRAVVDSHFELPIVGADRSDLIEADAAPFRALADLPIGMTAHVTYTAIDREEPGTTSAIVIGEIIRGVIGFQGLLLSDDVSMQALRGTLGERARRAFAAGVDIVLHCNGNLDEAAQVAAEAPILAGAALRRAQAALTWPRVVGPLDRVEARRELDVLLAMVDVA